MSAPLQIPVKTPEEERLELDAAIVHLFTALVATCAVKIEAFPEDQQKEARVLIKDVKEKLRKLRSMLEGKNRPFIPYQRESDS